MTDWHADLAIASDPRGTAAAARAALARRAVARPLEVDAYIDEVWRLAPLAGLDPAIVFAQAVLETGWFTSAAWRDRLNPAGIGVTDGGDHGYRWESGADAARAQIVHLDVYVHGDRRPAVAADVLAQYYGLDPRRSAVIGAGWAGTVRTIRDLTGRWATDRDYHDKIVRLARDIFGGSAMSAILFGQVVHPPFLDRLIPDSQTSAWDDLGPRRPVGVCQHSMVGTLWGTDAYFRRGRDSTGLTDYGIGGATDGERWDGVIVRWNDPRGQAHTVTYGAIVNGRVSANRAGWANGDTRGLEGDGPLFVRTLGVAAVNRDLVSIERSDGGNIATPMSPKQFESICALTAYWFDQARVPWDRFPFNPNTGCVTHMLHKEFSTKDCPFPPVTSRIDEIQDRVRALLRAAQTHTSGTPAPAPGQPSQPPPTPIEQDHEAWPQGWTLAALRERFGTLTRRQLDGTTRTYTFDPKGVISNAWVRRGVEKGYTRVDQLPRPVAWYDLDGGTGTPAGIVLFERHWALYRPAAPVVWRWVR